MARVEISEEPLRQLFGSVTAYHTLMYIAACGRGYAGEIARAHEHALAPVQRQLRKFESVGLLVSRMEGNTRFYYWGRGPIVAALEKFLLEMVDMLPEATYAERYVSRGRPRRQGKA